MCMSLFQKPEEDGAIRMEGSRGGVTELVVPSDDGERRGWEETMKSVGVEFVEHRKLKAKLIESWNRGRFSGREPFEKRGSA